MFIQMIQGLLDAGFPPDHMILECRKQIEALETLRCESEADALEVVEEIERIEAFMRTIRS